MTLQKPNLLQNMQTHSPRIQHDIAQQSYSLQHTQTTARISQSHSAQHQFQPNTPYQLPRVFQQSRSEAHP
jgi:hypothetical protein